MPIAVAFAKKINVIGFDLNAEKIALYKSRTAPTPSLLQRRNRSSISRASSIAMNLKTPVARTGACNCRD